MEVVDRPLLGIPEGMRAHMLTLTKRAMLNRAAAGIRGNVVIVNLPGKARSCKGMSWIHLVRGHACS